MGSQNPSVTLLPKTSPNSQPFSSSVLLSSKKATRMQKLRLLILIASYASASIETGQNTEEAELRQPKLFYVSSATTTTTISTQTVCYHVLSTATTNVPDPTLCSKRRRREIFGEGTVIEATQSKRNDAEADSENELKSSNNHFDDDRQGKFLNYWMTRTVTTTAYSYTVTSKMASLACTPQGFPYLRCSGF